MRKSFHAAQGIPCKTIRWTIPTQLAVDIDMTSKVVQLHEGEVVACLLTYALRQLHERWNAKAVNESATRIPDLPSLGADHRAYSLASLLREMESINPRRT